ncbi:hypothetical protein GC096_17195 [Paenibacillus sp. LMG 31461]|uniref:SLH domain-containing protein n=1 Tax=Paenibacillus plantarum TaxID=2654975 RepID=A0ABX1XBJ2_9BACL|nr:Ig-like domain-containing protein [Paenibacillus plantarum]NOU65774.1 hypothetical protein [Paenibacillus plantarum]
MRRVLSLGLCFMLLISFCLAAKPTEADAASPWNLVNNNLTWTLENDALRTKIEYMDNGSIRMTSFYNKAAGVEYMPQVAADNDSTLFHYNYRYLENGETGKEAIGTTQSLDANDGGYVLGTPTEHAITMKAADGQISTVGTRLEIPATKNGITVTLSFELYKGSAGLKYQAYLKNNSPNKRLQITSSDVIKLDFPDQAHNLHYAYITKWSSTTGGVDKANATKVSEDIKVIINRYDTGDGFYVGPEVNSKTEILKRDPSSPDTGAPYMARSFAGISAFKGDMVKVSTNPESLQLVLFPNEQFPYIAVNLAVFKGDIVDGKMAVETHLRERFKYNHTSTILNTNDWQWGTTKRNEAYYRSVAVPKTKAAGFDMVMFDDGWNNADDNGTSRDGTQALPSYTDDMIGLANYYKDQGLMFGLWFSMTGGYHNRGNDLADPAVIAAKKTSIEYMIQNYHLSHQMVDLTEFWPNQAVTTYSHPTDNVYRKNVLTNQVLNDVVDEYPDYKAKYTTEVDIWPTQGDRSNELLHVIDNGWTTSSTEYGETLDVPVFAGLFGHLPLNSVYFNIGDMTNGDMSMYYKYLFARNVKHGSDPNTWSQKNIDLMAKFNTWRKSERIHTLTDSILRPVYNGVGWDSNVAADWNQNAGPYVMMQVSDNKNEALMIATGGGKTGPSAVNVNLRWLDPAKQYLIEDISLDDTGVYTYRFKGLLTGDQLKNFAIDLDENSSKGRAYWIEAYQGDDYQVLYADEHVANANLSKNNGKLIIQGTGTAGSTGKVIVYGKQEQAVMIVDLHLDSHGTGQLSIDQFEATEDAFIPKLPTASTFVAADLFTANKTTVSGGTATKVSSGSTPNASAQGGMNFTSTLTTAGSYIEYSIPVPKAGVYNVQAAAKVSTSRGSGQWFIDGASAGGVWNQNAADSIKFFDLGTVAFQSAGDKKFRFVFQGGSNKTINTDRFVLTPVDVMPGSTNDPSIALTGASSIKKGESVTVSAQVNGLHPFYSTGDYVRWSVENQAAVNGSNKVISLQNNGLETVVTGVNSGTATLKMMSTINAKAVSYLQITVNAVLTSLTPVSVTTVSGTAPQLPTVVEATYSDNTKKSLAVTWDNISAGQYASVGTFTVFGDVAGTNLRATANVTVTAANTPVITTLTPVLVTTVSGTAPQLPTVVEATYSDNTKKSLAVSWDNIPAGQYASAGTFIVLGDVTGTNLRATANVTVNALDEPQALITSLTPVSVTTVSGTAPQLPTVVEATYSDNTKKSLAVSWDNIPAGQYASVGTFIVLGDVAGTNLRAKANVMVTAANTPEPTESGENPNPPTPSLPAQPTKENTITGEQLRQAIEKSKNNTLQLDVPKGESASSLIATLPLAMLQEIGAKGITQLAFKSGDSRISLPVQALRAEADAEAKNLTIIFSLLDAKALTEKEFQAVGRGSLYRLAIQMDDKPVTTLHGSSAKIEFAYKLQPGEKPEQVVVSGLTSDGKLKVLVHGTYRAATGEMVFAASEPGDYVVTYNNVTFDDLKGVSWAESSIHALAARDIVHGVDKGKFDPNSSVTRAEFLALLMRTFGLDQGQDRSSFNDIHTTDWYYSSVAAAQKLGIISGREDGSFGADGNISRQDMAVMMYRTLQLLKMSLSTNGQQTSFNDASQIASYAQDAITALQSSGMIEGSGGSFMPNDAASRAEAAVIIQRLLQQSQ